MKEDQSQYLLLKLCNGDEIIAKKSGTKKGFVCLNRPLQLQRSTFLDPKSGSISKNICIFRDWLEFSTDIDCEIPDSFVILKGLPDIEMVERYNNELDKLDRISKGEIPKPSAKKPTNGDFAKSTEDMLDDYFKSLHSPLPPSQPKLPQENKQSSGLLNIPPFGGGQLPINGQMVNINVSMPPEVFLNIILNLPMFDGWGQDMGDDSSEGDGGSDDDSEGEQPDPKDKPPLNKKKSNKDEDTPPSGWNGRFGFPK